jgi:signal transduction histidine kinase
LISVFRTGLPIGALRELPLGSLLGPTTGDVMGPIRGQAEVGRPRPARDSTLGRPPGSHGWVRVAAGTPAAGGCQDRTFSLRRAMAWVVVALFGVVATTFAAGTLTARRFAEQETIGSTTDVSDAVGALVVQPALHDELLSAEPAVAARAATRFDLAFRAQVPTTVLVEMRLLTTAGRVVYCTDPRMIGRVLPLDDLQRRALASTASRGRVIDLRRADHRQDLASTPVLETYRQVTTPGGHVLLFDSLIRYDLVSVRARQLWYGTAAITVASLVLLILAQAPVGWGLISSMRRSQRQRVALLDRAVTASETERRRIAGTLHDGAVQELAAAAFAVAGVADRSRLGGDLLSAQRLDTAAAALRASIGGLRSLLVDIYPPSLRMSGLEAALGDLATMIRARDVHTVFDIQPGLELPSEVEDVLFRAAQEFLRNTTRHANAHRVDLRLRYLPRGDPAPPGKRSAPPGGDPTPSGSVSSAGGVVVLEVADDGVGFDAASLISEPVEGHFGLQLLADLATDAGATLDVRSVPGFGTWWRLEAPVA